MSYAISANLRIFATRRNRHPLRRLRRQLRATSSGWTSYRNLHQQEMAEREATFPYRPSISQPSTHHQGEFHWRLA